MARDEAWLLSRLARGPCSGDELARELTLTRSGVWKRIGALREAGVEIVAERGRGYRLARPVVLLDADAIERQLPPPARSCLSRLEVVWETDSTNARLLAAPAPVAGCRVLLAERQSAGRGRRGRAWVSPLAANLYFSVSRRFHTPLARMGGLSLAVGVALAEAVAALGVSGAGVKWPNDVWVGRRKLAGVLIETGGELGGPLDVVVGVGLNVAMPEAEGTRIGQDWTDLLREGCRHDRNAVAAAVLGGLLPALEQFDRQGLPPFLERFARLDALAGAPIELASPLGLVRGRALGVADDGGLRVALDSGGEQRFHGGEASLRAVTEE